MTAPHEAPATGAAAGFAARLAGLLPRLTTPRLVLRAPRIADFDLWASVACTERGRYLGGPMDRDEAWLDFAQTVATWLLRGHGLWTVETRAGEALGFVLLGFEPGDHEPELGFVFRAEAEGQSYATEAAHAALGHAFGPLGWTTVVSYVDRGNARSAAVAERLGARRDAAAEAALGSGDFVYRYSRARVGTLSVQRPDANPTDASPSRRPE